MDEREVQQEVINRLESLKPPEPCKAEDLDQLCLVQALIDMTEEEMHDT